MKAILATCLSFVASQSLALTCMAPDVADTFKRYQSVPETYVIVHGVLDFDQSKMPEYGWHDPDAGVPGTRLDARLRGRTLTLQGYSVPFDREIIFNVVCIQSWCPEVETGSTVLAFVEVIGGDYVFSLGACFSRGFFDPDEATLDTAKSCMRGEACDPKFQ